MTPNLPNRLHGVLLAGGSGTRLWPLSTQRHPKQFLPLGSEGSLIQQTLKRLQGTISPENIWIVCGARHAEEIRKQIPSLASDHIIVEPEAKNTAPAIALAALKLKQKDPEALMAVLPADHLILPEDWKKFSQDLRFAAEVAFTERALVTFGIVPDHPSTGFGYLERGEKYESQGNNFFEVAAFHEKPDRKTAEKYLGEGKFYWNSGMFLWAVEVFLEELQRCQPQMYRQFLELEPGEGGLPSKSLTEIFSAVENISVDYAVMEKAKKVRMVSASFSWDDVGNLAAFAKVLPTDEARNQHQGEAFFLDAKDNLVMAGAKPIAMVGVEDLIVVDAPQAILVLSRKKVQEVKKMVQYLKKIGREDLL